jgi:hypothetical protein
MRRRLSFKKCAAAVAAVVMLEGMSANASWDFTTTGTAIGGSEAVSATASFKVVGGQLVVALQNTSIQGAQRVGGAVYGISFGGVTGLDLVSAIVPQNEFRWDYGVTGDGVQTTLTSPWDLHTLLAGNGQWEGTDTGATGLTGKKKIGLVSDAFTGPRNDALYNVSHNPLIEDSIVLTFDYTSIAQGGPSDVRILFNTDGSSFTAVVPEPTTMIAGALLLLPFGASTLRILRRRKA